MKTTVPSLRSMPSHRQHRHPRRETASRTTRTTRSTGLAVAIALFLLMALPQPAPVRSFTVMNYKPPVQTSVRKIAGSSSPASQRRTSSTSKKATVALGHSDAPASPFRGDPSRQQPRRNANSRRGSFQQRMRRAVLNKDATKTQPTHTEKERQRYANIPNMCEVETLQEYKAVVGDETERLVCVRFYAPWCRACKAMEPYFHRLAHRYPQVQFVNVPATDRNTNLHQGLGVPSLPFGHIYHPDGGLVEEMRITRPFMKELEQRLQSYVQMSCALKSVGDASSPYGTDRQETSEMESSAASSSLGW